MTSDFHLAIDTSTSRPVLALLEGEQVLFEWVGPGGTFHGETLLSGVDQALHSTRIQLNQLRFLSVGIGPGTFTGLRIGIVIAKFLAHVQKIPIVPVSSLYAQALNLWQQKIYAPSTRIWSLTDAKRYEVYAYKTTLAELDPACEISEAEEFALSPEALAERLQSGDILLGEGADNYSAHWPTQVSLAPPEFRYLLGKNIALIAWSRFQAGKALSAAELVARYIKTEKF